MIEGSQSEPKRKYQHKKCPQAVWERFSDGKMKRVELNKFNRQLFALTFSMQTIPPMDHKMPKKMMHFNYKQYKRSLRDNGDMLLNSMTVVDK